MNHSPDKSLQKLIELDFITIEIYEDFMVSTISEGMSFGLQHLAIVVDVFRKYFEDKKFVSIANRINDYTIDPACFQQNIHIENLLGIGVVCYSEASLEIAKFEKKFYNKIYETFEDIEAAKNWAVGLVEKKGKKAGL